MRDAMILQYPNLRDDLSTCVDVREMGDVINFYETEIDDFISFHEPLPPARNRGGGRDKQGRRANQSGSFGQGTVVH